MTGNRRQHVRPSLGRFCAWLPALVVSPFIVLFLCTALPRMGVPFELEWNEGQTGEQAMRFAWGLPLYPPPESGWVPYMYAPGYHVLLGVIFRLTNNAHLFWGRLVSVLATLATALALASIIRDRLRHPPAAAFAGLLWFAWYGPTGFWYDLARNDALAWALAAWGMALTLARQARGTRVAAGIVLLTLGMWTKQPVAPVAVFCGLYAIIRELREKPVFPAARVAAFACMVVSLALVLAFHRSASDWFWHYVVRNSIVHPTNDSIWQPFGTPYGERLALSDWLREARKSPPRVWTDGIRYVIILLLGIGASALVAWRARRKLRGLVFVIPACLLAGVAVSGYAKFGGYQNNFMPLDLGVTLLAACALTWSVRGVRRSRRGIAAAGFSLLVVLQTALVGGFYFPPSRQQPSADSRVVFDHLMTWLRERRAAGETVWIPHHQWYAVLTGHSMPMNPDMVRCAVWAGDSEPSDLARSLSGGSCDWVVLDLPDPQNEWLPEGMKAALSQHYRPAGTETPPLYHGSDQRALTPPTGAPMRPCRFWQRSDWFDY